MRKIYKVNSIIHGDVKHVTDSRLYHVWADMKTRCYNPKTHNYHIYGGKGIRVCQEWLDDYQNFENWAISSGYKLEVLPCGYNKWTLDRIDENKDYSPDNCRWATYKEQASHLTFNPEQTKSKVNKSGYVGIHWDKVRKKWVAQVMWNKKTIFNKGFLTQKEALEARNNFIKENNFPLLIQEYRGEYPC